MKEQFIRTESLIGEEGMRRLADARVAVFGIGGVGGYVCESLVRSGIGEFDLIDKDEVDITNLNRQIIATLDTVGQDKVEVMKARMLSINPDVIVHTHKCFFLPENAGEFEWDKYDYVVDAIDTVTAKIELIVRAKEAGIPIISAMGAGNKLDPSRFRVADISKTQVCPLAKVMRRELRARGIENLKVVYSDEPPIKGAKAAAACGADAPGSGVGSDAGDAATDTKSLEVARGGHAAASGTARAASGKASVGSTAFAPAVCGLLMGSEIVRDLTSETT